VLVNPLAPGVKIVGSALVSDALERADANTVVEWNGDGSLLSGIGMRVLQNRVVTTGSVVAIAELPEHGNDFFARKIPRNHLSYGLL
jgi:hypothetical protein